MHFSGLNPLWPDYVFNVMRGELVPGRFGTVHFADTLDDGSGHPIHPRLADRPTSCGLTGCLGFAVADDLVADRATCTRRGFDRGAMHACGGGVEGTARPARSSTR